MVMQSIQQLVYKQLVYQQFVYLIGGYARVVMKIENCKKLIKKLIFM